MASEATKLFGAANDEHVQPRRPLSRMVVITVGEEKLVWKALATQQGWYLRHSCGRLVHQWAHAHRPGAIMCPGCKAWVVAP
jgi:hypothetical protein